MVSVHSSVSAHGETMRHHAPGSGVDNVRHRHQDRALDSLVLFQLVRGRWGPPFCALTARRSQASWRPGHEAQRESLGHGGSPDSRGPKKLFLS
jgi:hypothetical protein